MREGCILRSIDGGLSNQAAVQNLLLHQKKDWPHRSPTQWAKQIDERHGSFHLVCCPKLHPSINDPSFYQLTKRDKHSLPLSTLPYTLASPLRLVQRECA